MVLIILVKVKEQKQTEEANKMTVKKTTEGLRDLLFQEIEDFLGGKVDSDHVKTITKASGAIMTTVAKDLEAAKLIHSMNEGRDESKAIANLNLDIALSSIEMKDKKLNSNK